MANRLMQISPTSPLIHIPTKPRPDLSTAAESTPPLSCTTYVSIQFPKASLPLYKLESRESSSNTAIPVWNSEDQSLSEWIQTLNWALEQGEDSR